MIKVETWKAKVADLKRFAEESLKQIEEDRECLLKLLQDLEDTLEMLQKMPSNPNIAILKYSSIEPKGHRVNATEVRLQKVVQGERIDLPTMLVGQREKIPTYRSIISHFEHIGTLLRICLKRISEAETFVG